MYSIVCTTLEKGRNMERSDELLLLDFWTSPFSMRVKIALEEKGISNYEIRTEDVYSDKKSSILLETNPVHRKVPVLIHNGKPICESLIIVEYIDEFWKDRSPSLMPVDPSERARARFWAHYIDNKFIGIGAKVWRVKEEAQNEAKKEFIGCLKLLEAELGDEPYFGGNTFGYLDIALIPDYSWFLVYETFANFNIEAEFPKIITWAKRCLTRESVRKSLPSQLQLYNFMLELNR